MGLPFTGPNGCFIRIYMDFFLFEDDVLLCFLFPIKQDWSQTPYFANRHRSFSGLNTNIGDLKKFDLFNSLNNI